MLGRKPLRPPKDAFASPDLSLISRRLPPVALPDGTRIHENETKEALRLAPPETHPHYGERETWQRAEGHRTPHWHGDGHRQLFHDNAAWGVHENGAWLWTLSEHGRWWTLTEDGRPLLWHDGHWWWRGEGVWFVIHDNEPWAYRWFSQWKEEGLIHPKSGTQILYSNDETKAAVIVPGEGTTVFDLKTGRELAGSPDRHAPARPFDAAQPIEDLLLTR